MFWKNVLVRNPTQMIFLRMCLWDNYDFIQIRKMKKLDKWVYHELNERDNQNCLKVLMLHSRHKCYSFPNRIVTCDGKWIYYDNHTRSAQWLNNNEWQSVFQRIVLIRRSWWWVFGDLKQHGSLRFHEASLVHHNRNILQSTKEIHAKNQPG